MYMNGKLFSELYDIGLKKNYLLYFHLRLKFYNWPTYENYTL